MNFIPAWRWLIPFVFLAVAQTQGSAQCTISHESKAKVARYLGSISYHDYTTRYLLVIPMDGCGGCKDIAIRFQKKCSPEQPIKFIMSSSSKKRIDLTIRQEKLDIQKIIKDPDDMLQKLSLSNGNPVLLEFQNKKICSYKILLPSIIDQELSSIFP